MTKYLIYNWEQVLLLPALGKYIISPESTKYVTAFRNITVLPSDEGIQCVTPGRAFRSTRISAIIFSGRHFRENVFRSRLRMRLSSEPLLALNSALSGVCLTLIVAAVFFDTVCCKKKKTFIEIPSFSSCVTKQTHIVIQRSKKLGF